MTEKTVLQERVESGQSVVMAEIAPPASDDAAHVRRVAKLYAGKVHGLGVSDNRQQVCMSALAAASVVGAEGVEPILHVVTRDRNRIALIAEYLGAKALGIRNILCTSGTHQTLGHFRSAKNVFDLDSIQLMQSYAQLAVNGSVVGETTVKSDGALCLGGTAAPYADPMELQIRRLAKKVAVGAQFLITQPVFDLDRFQAWWNEVTTRGLHQKCAVVAGIRVLTDIETAAEYAKQRPLPMVPDTVLERIGSKSDPAAQRAEGIAIAVETIGRLSTLDGLRGFEVCGDGDDEAALEVIDKSGLGTK